jgi:predicted aconitase
MTKDLARRVGYVDIIEKAGGNVVADTCMVVAPIEEMGYKTTGTNSGKAGAYLPGFCKQKVVFASTENLLKLIIE